MNDDLIFDAQLGRWRRRRPGEVDDTAQVTNTVRVPMLMMDSAQRDMAEKTQRAINEVRMSNPQPIQDNGRQEYLDQLTNAWKQGNPNASSAAVMDSRPPPSPNSWKDGLTNDELADMADEQRWTDYFNGKRDAEDAANREGDSGYHDMCARIENAWRA